ncbi:hypothetical protein RJ55_00193 [Drechmeria coniospora]|nr:hypothetical protein RJ55_00193 [Drechmeria coniospora]
MSRRRAAGSESGSGSFNLRWHSVVNPGTPSADIMSSPDPLNDETLAAGLVLPPSSPRRVTRSITRSTHSRRFLSRSRSPRKQTFELQVGDTRSPQKLLVTVETDDGLPPLSNPRRKLFQSPAPPSATRRRGRAVTTTVPLRDTIEEVSDDPSATPRHRGRPRKNNGTPMPSAAKKRAGTPLKQRTPRRAKTTDRDPEHAPSEPSVGPTLPSDERATPIKSRMPELSSEAGSESATRRNRRRSRAVDLAEPAAANPTLPRLQPSPRSVAHSDDEMELIGGPWQENAQPDDELASDLPLPAMPNDATPKAPPPRRQLRSASLRRESSPVAPATEPQPPSPDRYPAFPPSPSTSHRDSTPPRSGTADVHSDPGEAPSGHYLELAAPSDRSSVDEPTPRNNDTIAQGEEFSMIFMDSIPSLQGYFNSSIPPAAHDARRELGKETSLIANGDLEPRTGRSSSREGDALSLPHAPPKSPQKEDALLERQQPDDAPVDAEVEQQPLEANEHEAARDELASDMHPLTRPVAAISPRRDMSPRRARSPRKAIASSPLRHRVLKFTAHRAEDAAAVSPERKAEDRTPRVLGDSGHPEGEALNGYDDSFSEIPDEYLAAAVTPTMTRVGGRLDHEPSNPHQGSFSPIPRNSPATMAPERPQRQIEKEQMPGPDSWHKTFAHSTKDGIDAHWDALQDIQKTSFATPNAARTPNQAADRKSGQDDVRGDTGRLTDEVLNLYEDSFSEIPEQILAAAAPGEREEVDRIGDDELRHDAPRVQEGVRHQREILLHQQQGKSQHDEPRHDGSQHEESQHDEALSGGHSERGHDQQRVEVDSPSGQQNRQLQHHQDTNDLAELEEPPVPSDAHSAVLSDTGRMPTPNNARSKAGTEGPGDEWQSLHRVSPKLASPGSRVAMDEGTKPPPELDEPEQDGEGSDAHPELSESLGIAKASTHFVDQTPADQNSSPLPESPSLQQDGLQDKTVRPVFSAILRAGRMLQSITSDPPSPEGREKHLGSPFRSSGSKESWNGSRDSQNSRRRSRSPQRPMAFAEPATASDRPASRERVDDAPQSMGEGAFARATRIGAVDRASEDKSPSRGSAASSMHITPPSDGALSWVVEEGPISPRLRGDSSLQQAYRHSVAKYAASPGLVNDVVGEATRTNQESEAGSDDGTDIWELEARRETPKQIASKQESSMLGGTVSRDDLSRMAAGGEGDDFGDDQEMPQQEMPQQGMPQQEVPQQEMPQQEMLQQEMPQQEAAQQDPKRTAHRQEPFGTRVRRGGRPLPGNRKTIPEPAGSTKDVAVAKEHPSTGDEGHGDGDALALPQASDADEFSILARHQQSEEVDKKLESASKRFELTSFFSSPAIIPAMMANKPPPANTRVTAKTNRPGQQSPIRAASSFMPTRSMFPQGPPKEILPEANTSRELFPSALSGPDPAEKGLATPLFSNPRRRSTSPMEESIVTSVDVMRKTFTPRPRPPSPSFFRASTQHAVTETPPRMQLSHADIHRWQQETSNASDESPAPGRLLRPLPPKNASPTKSSLRSPLKPHTPGRVVEFTSSVLSPAEQARARQELRLSNSLISEQSPSPSPAAPAQSAVSFSVPYDDGEDDDEEEEEEEEQEEEQPEEEEQEEEGQEAESSSTDPDPGSGSTSASTASGDDDAERTKSAGTGPFSMQRSAPGPQKRFQTNLMDHHHLSRTRWSRDHWLLLSACLRRRRKGRFEAGPNSLLRRYLGRMVKSRGQEVRLEPWHIECMEAFVSEMGGWNEAELAKRFVALLLGERRRARLRAQSEVMFT